MSRADPRNDGDGDAIGQEDIGDHAELDVRNPGLALTRAVREGRCGTHLLAEEECDCRCEVGGGGDLE